MSCRTAPLWILLFVCRLGLAQSSLDVSASLRSEAWSSNRLLDDQGALAATSAWLSLKWPVGPDGEYGQWVGRGWVRATTQRDGASSSRVRELYWSRKFGDASIRIGRQIIQWGKTDGLNPTDNLSPSDYTLLTADDNEQRNGRLGLSAKLPTTVGTLSLVWFDRAASHKISLPNVQGVTYIEQGNAAHKSQMALKWEFDHNYVDGSLSYFDGTDLWPDLNIAAVSPLGLVVALRNQRARVVGADMIFSGAGSIVWRTEAAWLLTESSGRHDFNHKKPQLWLVGGPEFRLSDRLNLGLQGSYKKVFNHASADEISDPIVRDIARKQMVASGQSSREQVGLTWRLTYLSEDTRLALDFNGFLQKKESLNGVLRIGAKFVISDSVSLRAGTVRNFGAENTQFGQLKANNLYYLQTQWDF